MNVRDNKLNDALDNITKRLLIDNANTLGDVSYVKKVQDAVPVARATDFFKNLKYLSDKWDELIKNQGDKLRDLFDRLLKNYDAILRRKLVQWKDKAELITKEAAKKKIGDFFENKYKTGLARDNWQKLAKSLDIYSRNKDLYSLKKRIALQLMEKSIDDAFKKLTLDQLRDGADYVNLIKFKKDYSIFGKTEIL